MSSNTINNMTSPNTSNNTVSSDNTNTNKKRPQSGWQSHTFMNSDPTLLKPTRHKNQAAAIPTAYVKDSTFYSGRSTNLVTEDRHRKANRVDTGASKTHSLRLQLLATLCVWYVCLQCTLCLRTGEFRPYDSLCRNNSGQLIAVPWDCGGYVHVSTVMQYVIVKSSS